MSATRIQTHAVKNFTCLGDACPDTCCKGWGMQLTQETIDKYKNEAPQLLDAVTSGEAEFIMRRDPVTDYCVKFDAGWCAIHRDHGPEFLGDACHFYPRVTRALDETVVTSIALSCPEAARLMLYGDDPFATTPREELRVPFSLRNYLPEGLSSEQALTLHQHFVREAGNPDFTAERNAMRALVVARALETQPAASWPEAATFYFTMAESRLSAPEPNVSDLNHLAQALMGLVVAGRAEGRTGLMAIAASMQEALGIRIDPATRNMQVAPDAMARGVKLLHGWKQHAETLQPVLRRYLQAQCSQAMFPLAGLGKSPAERMVIIGVRLATLKLALMAQAQTAGTLEEADVVRITYTLARFLDHLADPALSLAVYSEAGWVRDARLRALLGDA